ARPRTPPACARRARRDRAAAASARARAPARCCGRRSRAGRRRAAALRPRRRPPGAFGWPRGRARAAPCPPPAGGRPPRPPRAGGSGRSGAPGRGAGRHTTMARIASARHPTAVSMAAILALTPPMRHAHPWVMRAILVREPGDESVLTLGDAPPPTLGPADLRIRVRAAGVNRADLMQRQGLYPPPPGASSILGLECAGEVIEVGPEAHGFRVGQRAMALL